jgi:hypothetical protein
VALILIDALIYRAFGFANKRINGCKKYDYKRNVPVEYYLHFLINGV